RQHPRPPHGRREPRVQPPRPSRGPGLQGDPHEREGPEATAPRPPRAALLPRSWHRHVGLMQIPSKGELPLAPTARLPGASTSRPPFPFRRERGSEPPGRGERRWTGRSYVAYETRTFT